MFHEFQSSVEVKMLAKTLLFVLFQTLVSAQDFETTIEPRTDSELCNKPQELIFEDLKKFYCKLDLNDKRELLLCPVEKVSSDITEDLLSTLR